jgi:hypothetical protein
MTQTLELHGVPDELIKKLDDRLREIGKDRERYMIDLIERDLNAPTLSQILEPFRKQVADSGMTDEELEQLFGESREEAHQERRGGQG